MFLRTLLTGSAILALLGCQSRVSTLHDLRDGGLSTSTGQTGLTPAAPRPRAGLVSTPTPRGDLYAFARTGSSTGKTDIHGLSSGSDLQKFFIQTPTALGPTGSNFELRLGDWDRDGIPDLFAIAKSQTGSGKTEVHIFSGASSYQTPLVQTGTLLGQVGAQFSFDVVDINGDGQLDVAAVARRNPSEGFNTGSGTVEVFVLNGATNFQTFLMATGTGMQVAGSNFDFRFADLNGNGSPEFIALARSGTGSHSVEVHSFTGTAFRTPQMAKGTPIPELTSSQQLELGDWNRDGTPDLFVINRSGTSGRTEVSAVSGAGGLSFWLFQNKQTALSALGSNFTFGIWSPINPSVPLTVNLGANPGVLVSGTTGANAGPNAFDVKPETYWLPSGTAGSIRWDLGSILNVSAVEATLRKKSTASTSLALYGSTDGANYSLLTNLQRNSPDYDIVALTFSPRSVRYLRLDLSGSGGLGVRELETYESKPLNQLTIPKWFSFWGSDYDGYITSPAQVSYSNMTWIRSDEAGRLALARQNGLKAVIDVMNVFFDLGTPSFNINLPFVVSNYDARWTAYVDLVRPYANEIEAIQILDEPGAQIFIRGDLTGSQKTTAVTNLRNFISTIVIPKIRTAFPNAKILLTTNALEMFPAQVIASPTFRYPTLSVPTNYQFQFPTGVDWVGFDCYDGWFDCGGVPMETLYAELKAKKTAAQKIHFIPPATYIYDTTDPHGRPLAPYDEHRIRAMSNRFFSWALRDPSTIALFPWEYQSFTAGTTTFYGAQSLPLSLQVHQAEGRFIKLGF